MFGCFFIIFRSVASLILGLVFFFAFLAFLMVDNFRDNFLTAEFYTDSLSENDAYNRIYDKVLLDPEFEDTTRELLGDIDVPQDDIADVAREIIPPDYLRDQTEGAVHGIIDYLNKDTDTPDVFIDLSPPLERVKPALFSYIDQRIDELEDVPVTTFEELEKHLQALYRTLESGDIPEQVPLIEDPEFLVDRYVNQTIADLEEVPVDAPEDFQRELQSIYNELSNGRLPTRIPSIQAIPEDVRLSTYDAVFEAVRSELPEETVVQLEEQEEAIKAELREGNVTGALRVATPALTGPVVGEFVDDAYDKAFKALEEEGFPKAALDGLNEREDAIKENLGAGNIKESLKLGARGLSEPLIDEALDELREELDEQDRLDLVAKAAKQNDQTKEKFLDDLDPLRDVIDRAELGSWASILIMVLAAMFMSAVHFPHLASSLRWPGITLLLSGLVFLITGLVLKSRLQDDFGDLLDRADVSPIPPSMMDIISDVLTSMATDATSGFITPSITIMVVGGVLLIGSFFIRKLHIPFLSR